MMAKGTDDGTGGAERGATQDGGFLVDGSGMGAGGFHGKTVGAMGRMAAVEGGWAW